MSVLFDDDISGAGDAALVGDNRVIFVLAYFVSFGPDVRMIDETNRMLNLGYFALKNTAAISDVESRTFLRAPVWFDWDYSEWSPVPQAFPGGVFPWVYADGVRWWLSSGTHGHLRIEGP